MDLSQLKNRAGTRKKRKIVGRGPGSGHGKTSGRGHKGQNSRSGGGVRPGFEGGQMPLIRRLPKRGFNNKRFQIAIRTINVSEFEKLKGVEEITPEILKERGLIKGRPAVIKVLGNGEVKHPFVVKAHRFTKGAKEKIEKAQGKWIQL